MAGNCAKHNVFDGSHDKCPVCEEIKQLQMNEILERKQFEKQIENHYRRFRIYWYMMACFSVGCFLADFVGQHFYFMCWWLFMFVIGVWGIWNTTSQIKKMGENE